MPAPAEQMRRGGGGCSVPSVLVGFDSVTGPEDLPTSRSTPPAPSKVRLGAAAAVPPQPLQGAAAWSAAHAWGAPSSAAGGAHACLPTAATATAPQAAAMPSVPWLAAALLLLALPTVTADPPQWGKASLNITLSAPLCPSVPASQLAAFTIGGASGERRRPPIPKHPSHPLPPKPTVPDRHLPPPQTPAWRRSPGPRPPPLPASSRWCWRPPERATSRLTACSTTCTPPGAALSGAGCLVLRPARAQGAAAAGQRAQRPHTHASPFPPQAARVAPLPRGQLLHQAGRHLAGQPAHHMRHQLQPGPQVLGEGGVWMG